MERFWTFSILISAIFLAIHIPTVKGVCPGIFELESSLITCGNDQLYALARNGSIYDLPHSLPCFLSACATSKYIFFRPRASSLRSGFNDSYIYRTTFILDSQMNLLNVSANAEVFYTPALSGDTIEDVGEGLTCNDKFVYATSWGETGSVTGRIYQFSTTGPANQLPSVLFSQEKLFISSISLDPNDSYLYASVYNGVQGFIYQITTSNGGQYNVRCSSSTSIVIYNSTVVATTNNVVFQPFNTAGFVYFKDATTCGNSISSATAPVQSASILSGSDSFYSLVAEVLFEGSFGYTQGLLLPTPLGTDWSFVMAIPGSQC